MSGKPNAPEDDRVSQFRVRVGTRLLCTQGRPVPQGLTKVAQHFSAGSTFYNMKRPVWDDRSELYPLRYSRVEKQPFLSSLTRRTSLLLYFPAPRPRDWATFAKSLRDDLKLTRMRKISRLDSFHRVLRDE